MNAKESFKRAHAQTPHGWCCHIQENWLPFQFASSILRPYLLSINGSSFPLNLPMAIESIRNKISSYKQTRTDMYLCPCDCLLFHCCSGSPTELFTVFAVFFQFDRVSESLSVKPGSLTSIGWPTGSFDLPLCILLANQDTLSVLIKTLVWPIHGWPFGTRIGLNAHLFCWVLTCRPPVHCCTTSDNQLNNSIRFRHALDKHGNPSQMSNNTSGMQKWCLGNPILPNYWFGSMSIRYGYL